MSIFRFFFFIRLILAVYAYFFTRRILQFYGVNVHTWYGLILPAIPAALLFVTVRSIWGIGFPVVMHLVGIALAADICAWIIRHLFAGARDAALYQYGHVLYRCGILPFLLTAVIMLYGYINMNHIIRTDYTIRTGKTVNEYTIALLTDIHFGTCQPKKVMMKAVEEINDLNPDIVLLGGDIVDEEATHESMAEVFEILGKIRNRYGIYYVYGNHDKQPYTAKKAFTREEFEAEITGNGIHILRDERVEIGGDLTLAGRDDAAWGNTSNRMKVHELLSGINPDTFVIVADHQPIEYKECAENGADLELSGHTHAGQIWPVGVITTLSGNLNYGLYHKDGIDVIVSSGIAGWGYPVRTGKHCEYVMVHILPEKRQD